MRRTAAVAALVVLAAAFGAQAADRHGVEASGIQLRVPAGWARVAPPDDEPVTDPRTVLVVGTKGVAARESRCQVAAYRIPADGAAVVVLGWRGQASPAIPRSREELQELRLEREHFACWDDRGASAQIALRGRAYQLNVMVSDRASTQVVSQALAVARSFSLAQ